MRLVIAAVAILGLATCSNSAVLLVPQEYATIQDAVDDADYGDVVEIAEGVYQDCTNVPPGYTGPNCCIVLGSGVTVRGASGDPRDVVIDARELGRVVTCDDGIQDARIEGVTLRGGAVGGAAVFVRFAGHVVLDSCIIEDNHCNYGVASVLAGSLIELFDCTLRSNSAFDGVISIVDYSRAELTGCTMVDNGGALYLGGTGSTASLDNCVGVSSFVGSNMYGDVLLSCCNLYADSSNAWGGYIENQLGQDGNISEDPLFCDEPGGDLHLQPTSPCAPVNSGCGLMGAWGVGCQVAPVQATTWGLVKSLYTAAH